MQRLIVKHSFEISHTTIKGPKKLAWTDLDQVLFENFCQRVECQNWKIGVDWSRQGQKKLWNLRFVETFQTLKL
jgi:hypothetical protein